MGIEKFRFVSPGVQINEIDDSILPTPLAPVGPVVIGNTTKGPSMQPVVVSTLAELDRVFGVPTNGIVGATDVWRTGVPTSPTLATYAARAFLSNAFPITVVRLSGVPADQATQTGQPGWKADKVTHVVVKTGSAGHLAANIYHKSAVTVQLLSGSSTYISAGSASIANANTKEFTLKVTNGAVVDAYNISFDRSKSSFIRDVLNTNPSKYDTDGFFLGESYENSLGFEDGNGVSQYDEMYVTSSTTLSDFRNWEGATSAASPWIIGDVVSGSLNVYSKLFRFVGLNNGSYLSKDIKICIENVRKSKNDNITKYGTFDVVVRNLFETSNSVALERFSDLTLDPGSDNYILRKIGDSSRRWNSESERYEEEGTYANLSAYVRVELSGDDVAPSDLPRGFLIPGMPNHAAFGSPAGLTISHPVIETLVSCKKAAGKSTRFGLVSKSVENADLVDLLAQKPFNTTTAAETLFHTRFLSASLSNYTYVSASHYDSTDILTAGSVLGFDLPLYGGFEAKNILTKEPFINNYDLGQSGVNENTNAAYRAIKQAIDIVSQPEIIDMNMLVVPGLQNPDLTDYVMSVCKERGDSLGIIDLEGDYLYDYEGNNNSKEKRPTKVVNVVETLKSRKIDNSYGAAYFPAVFVPTEGIFLPASVAALGAIGGTEGRQALWFAPAGFNRGGLTVLNSGIGVSRTALSLIASDRDSLYNVNINPIATFPNEGVVIFGQKTLQATPSALDRVNVRRLVNYLKKQISRYATKVLFEPNVEATWNSFKAVVEPFLLGVKNGFGIDDARVVLDPTTTTADLIDRNTMYCKIYIKPTRAIEYIAIDFIVTNSGAAFTEGV